MPKLKRSPEQSLGRTGLTSRLQVSYLAPDALKPDPANPRKHDRAQLKRLAKSIETFGFLVPAIVNANDEIVCGHARVLVAAKCNMAEIPVIRVEHLTDAQLRAFMIAENRLNELSSWDDQLLAQQLRLLDSLKLDFEIEATGFDIPEIDLRIESLNSTNKAEPDRADSLPEALGRDPISKLHDVWRLGRHRVICHNSTESAAYSSLMQGELAAMMFTDPPYNVKIDGHASGLGKVRHRDFIMGSGEMSRADYTRFLISFASLAIKHSVDGALHFVFADWRHLAELVATTDQVYSELKNLCIWAKHNAGMGSLYRSQHELVFVLKHGRGRHRNNVELGKHGRHRSNVWSYRGFNDFGRETEEGNLPRLHPTVKPVALVADAILDCSVRGDIVLDPFLGSGTTTIAAERTGRRCYGIELDPRFVDITVRRWQAFTGDDAVLTATGETFKKIASKLERQHVHTKKAN